MVPELSEAAKNETIKDALINKISKERIGTEVEKMLNGPYPLLSLKLIYQYGLYSTVFEPPKNMSHAPTDSYQAVCAVGAVKWLIMDKIGDDDKQQQQNNNDDIIYLLRQIENNDERHILYLGAALLPYLNITVELKKKTSPAVELIIRDSLKLKNQIINTICTLFRGINIFKETANHHSQNKLSRSELGMIIRDIGVLWKTSLKLALIHDLIFKNDINWEHPDELDVNLESVQDIIYKYSSLLHQAKLYGIEDSHTWKPIIDVNNNNNDKQDLKNEYRSIKIRVEILIIYLLQGKKATQLLGLKPGPVVQELLRVTMIWQFENPQGTVDECATMLKSYWDNKQA